MKIILSESQVRKLREDHSDFIIAPYPTPEEYRINDPEGYNRSKELGTLDLYYPNRPPEPKRKRGRPKKEYQPNSDPLYDDDGYVNPKASIGDLLDKKRMGRPKRDIHPGMWVSTHTEDFKIISNKDGRIIARSFCKDRKSVV